jgi:hypothetical protein
LFYHWVCFSTKTIRPIFGLYPQFDAEHVIIEKKKKHPGFMEIRHSFSL